MKHRRFVLVGLIGFISLTSGGWFYQDGSNDLRSAAEKRRLFEQILQYVAEYYVDSIDAGQLYDMAIEGMLDQLDDPYTSFLRKQAYGDLSLSTTGNYGGVGLRIDLRDGWVTVVSPIPDSPSERAGLAPGDQLVEIEGRTTKGWDTQDAANVLRGEPGTVARVTVVRAGIRDSLEFELTRARIHVSSVEGAMMLTPSVGYLALTNVTEQSARELRGEVTDLRAEGAEALIIDLRDNPGGILNQGVALADLFLDPNDVVVETRGRAPGASEIYKSDKDEVWPEMPVVVLVNRFTASAAEILAGALQDNDRALVLGTATFGKGVAYLLIGLSKTEAVTVTSSRWYTPSGRSIQRIRSAPPEDRLLAQQADAIELPDTNAHVFTTTGGREIKAGDGGIQPDILLPRDTLTDAEQRFAEALGSNVPTYRNVLSRYALDLKGGGTITDPNFAVTDAMLDEILVRLRAAEVEITDESFDGARRLIAEQFAPELTRYVFGRDAEIRRRAVGDNQTQHAIELLTTYTTPAALISYAASVSQSESSQN